MAGIVQSILLHKPISREKAEAILKRNGFKASKVDETENYLRYRQRDPKPLERQGYRFRTVPMGKIGEMILAYPPA